jgi:hypothetical protein
VTLRRLICTVLLGLLPLGLAPLQAQEVETATGNGAVLRVLDKINGEVEDLSVANGASASLWRLQVDLGECRYPTGNPAGDAFAFLTLRHQGQEEPLFRGWMIASAPALNALDHPRYDVWVIRCTTS